MQTDGTGTPETHDASDHPAAKLGNAAWRRRPSGEPPPLPREPGWRAWGWATVALLVAGVAIGLAIVPSNAQSPLLRVVPGPSDADAGRRREVPRRPDRPARRLDPPRRDPRRRRALRPVASPDHAPRAVRRGRLPRHDPRGPAAGAGGRDGPVDQRDHGLPVAAGGRARGDAVRRGDGAGLVRPATPARAGRRVRAHGARGARAAAARRGLPDRRGVLAAPRVDHGGVRVRVLRPGGRLPRLVRARREGRAPGSRRRAG